MRKLKYYFEKFQNPSKYFSRTYIIPSQFGSVYIFITFLSFIFSLSFGHPLSYFFSIILLVFFVAIAFISNSYMRAISVQVYFPKILKSNQEESLEFSFIHSANSPICLHLVSLSDDDFIETKKYTKKVNFKGMGILSDFNFKIYSYYPFFLFKTWRNIRAENFLVVCPIDDLIQHASSNEESEVILRDFEHADNFSRVNWKKSTSDRLFVNALERVNIIGDSRQVIFSLIHDKMEKSECINYLKKIHYYYSSNQTIVENSGRVLSRNDMYKNIMFHIGGYFYEE